MKNQPSKQQNNLSFLSKMKSILAESSNNKQDSILNFANKRAQQNIRMRIKDVIKFKVNDQNSKNKMKQKLSSPIYQSPKKSFIRSRSEARTYQIMKTKKSQNNQQHPQKHKQQQQKQKKIQKNLNKKKKRVWNNSQFIEDLIRIPSKNDSKLLNNNQGGSFRKTMYQIRKSISNDSQLPNNNQCLNNITFTGHFPNRQTNYQKQRLLCKKNDKIQQQKRSLSLNKPKHEQPFLLINNIENNLKEKNIVDQHKKLSQRKRVTFQYRRRKNNKSYKKPQSGNLFILNGAIEDKSIDIYWVQPSHYKSAEYSNTKLSLKLSGEKTPTQNFRKPLQKKKKRKIQIIKSKPNKTEPNNDRYNIKQMKPWQVDHYQFKDDCFYQ